MRYTFAACELDTQLYTLRRAGQSRPLRPKVFHVLRYLVEQRHRVVPKQELLEHVWPEQFISDATLENCLKEVRQVIGDSGRAQRLIHTLRGHGYRFVAAVTRHDHATDVLPDPSADGAVPPEPVDDRAPPGLSTQPLELPGWRQLTVLRCELVEGSTLAGLDPEDCQQVLQAFSTTCAQVIQGCNGYIAQYDSDGLLVYFGYPVADEAAAQQAVRAGLALIAAVQRLRHPMEQAPSKGLTARVGIHTGPAVVEELMPPASPALRGATLLLSKRLQACAMPGTVVLSAATYPLVQGYFTCQALAEALPIGDHQRLGLYRVLGESGRHNRLEIAAPHGLTPFVGREPELALLLQRWAQVQDGLGQVIMLCGEPGIGKSRLVQVLQDRVAAEAGIWMEWRGLPAYQHSAFSPVIAHLQRLLPWERDTAPEEKLHTLETALAQHPMGLAAVVPLFAALLSLPLPERYPPLVLTPQRQKQHTLDALLAWLLAQAAGQPVLLIVEDLHWVDPSTQEFLTLVVDQGPTARLYSLFTFRPEFTPPWHGRAHCTPLTLGRLSQPHADQMVQSLTGGTTLPAELRTHIVVKTDGVPLFVEELTKVVLESERLQADRAADIPNGPRPALAVPATLQDSLMVRLDRLGPTRTLAQLGATLGREFSSDLLQAVAPLTAEALQHGLRQLVEAEILYQRGVPPQKTYVFKHALIQETAYQSLLRSTRRQYHQRIAQVLEARFPETVETQPELLAHHCTEAGLHAQAVGYWQQAGQRAIERSANLEAIGHLTTGLDVLTTLPDTPARRQHELTLLITLGVPLRATKGLGAPEVGQVYARARALCQQVEETPHLFPVLRGLWEFYELQGELQTARAVGEQLLTLAQRAREADLLLVAHSVLGDTLLSLGECAGARAHLEQGFALYNPQQHRAHAFLYGYDSGVHCLVFGAWALWYLGYPDHALRRIHDALTLAQELSHPFSLAFALAFAAWIHHLRREGPAAQEQAALATALATDQGFALWEAWEAALRGSLLAEQGQHAEGMAQLRQGIAAWRATGAALQLPYYLALLAQAYGQAGQAAEGLRVLAEALTAVHKTGERQHEAEIYRLKGELLLRQGASDMQEAEHCLCQAVAVARQQQAKSLELRAAMSLARLWQQRDKRQAAYDLLVPLYGWFSEGFDTADLQEAKALLEALA